MYFAAYVGKSTANTGGQNTKATSDVDSSQVQTDSGLSQPCGEWCEATTPEGYVYYWNTVTKGKMLQLFTEMCLFELSVFCSWFMFCLISCFLFVFPTSALTLLIALTRPLKNSALVTTK